MEQTIAAAKAAKKGDKAAFGELFAQFSPEMYRYALFCLGDREAAQDAVQEAALEAYRGIAGLKKPESAKAWFFKILYAVCKRGQREKYEADFVDLDESRDVSAEDSAAAVLKSLETAQLLARLNETDRQLLLLSVVGGYSGKEIARMAGMTHGAVRTRISRALAALRKGEEQ
ncbi:MAG: sigma-70 family RNA polymerase sigma factor [Clostridia bacterium]|nr:sigma-70 family RNA polymerase sigma factor [Clostridia bacterium]